jgi:hypothetical protein
MDTTRIENRIGVRASAEKIWDAIADLENWHHWNPFETSLKGSLGFSAPLSFEENFPSVGPRQVQATITEWEPCGQLLWAENRGFLFRSMRYYEIESLETNACVVTNGLLFGGLRGEMYHDKHRAKIRPHLLTINENLKAYVEA